VGLGALQFLLPHDLANMMAETPRARVRNWLVRVLVAEVGASWLPTRNNRRYAR
jgi:hypothetical protein